jgi:SAM-dependent methyltransferase
MQPSNFDPVAASYDAQFTHTAIGRLQRAVVQDYLQAKIRPGTAVLEVNCGTGADALWLAEQGCTVLATDNSAEMLRVTAEKARSKNQQHRIQTQALDLRDLPSGLPRFDLVFSNFGGLNCLSPDALEKLGAAVPGLLRPGGLFVAVIMGRFCWWEMLYFLLKNQFRQATRRWRGGPVDAPLGIGSLVPTWYYAPAEFSRFFPNLALQTVQPVGFWLPPSYLDPWFGRRPGLLRWLNFLEKKCRGRLWAYGADHVLLVFKSGQA